MLNLFYFYAINVPVYGASDLVEPFCCKDRVRTHDTEFDRSVTRSVYRLHIWEFGQCKPMFVVKGYSAFADVVGGHFHFQYDRFALARLFERINSLSANAVPA